MLLSDFLLFVACLATTTLGLIVSESIDVVGNANHFGDLYIDPGVYLAFDNRNGYIRNTFDGVVTVKGQLFVIDTGNNAGMTVTFGLGFTNDSDVVLNAATQTSACDFRFTGSSFVNSGHIYMFFREVLMFFREVLMFFREVLMFFREVLMFLFFREVLMFFREVLMFFREVLMFFRY